ncbi:heme NO-binding domain-containing protein [Flavobacterium salmonis]|uniref:Heme NO-binding domain-containing protein n=1 Tax=Flavobacterium salmonis TaxID=2654844 RepID=A0A6V6Z6A3_9FLAO|nr:heme NO-binding domain-containing protein [Flavobacterium salmonis]CAD0007311.1 hypothetical protein FLAT13_03776 [Flavobacterium salmonis]
MYGIIYKAFEQYVIDTFDVETWNITISKSLVSMNTKTIDQPYNDAITFEIAKQLSKSTNLAIDKILFQLGEYVVKITREKYLLIMQFRDNDFKDYLLNLPSFHNRMLLIYPKLTPPEFKVTVVNDTILMLHYYTNTSGMKEYIKGYLNGLIRAFESNVEIEHIVSRQLNKFEDVFKISW